MDEGEASSGDRLAILHELALELSQQGDRRRLVEAVVLGARRLLGVAFASALSWDSAQRELVIEATSSDLPGASDLPASDLALCAGPAFASRGTVVVDDLEAHPHATTLARRLGLGAAAATPMPRHGGGAAVGVLFVASATRGPLSDELRRLLGLLAAHAGLALANAESVSGAARRLARVEQLAVASRGLLEAHDRDLILRRALDSAIALLAADRAAIYLTNPREQLDFVAARRISRTYLEEAGRRYRQSAGGLVPVTRAPVFVSDLASDPRTRVLHDLAAHEGVHSVLFMPLLHRGQLLGALALYHDVVWHYDPDDLAPVRALADDLALALANQALMEAMRRDLLRLSALERTARALLEAGAPAERARRGAQALIDAGAATAVWVLRSDGAALREEAACGGAALDVDEVRGAAHAALAAGRVVVRTVVGVELGMELVAAPMRGPAGPVGALVVALPRARPAEPPPPTVYVSFAAEPDHVSAVELVGAGAQLFAGLARDAQPTAALRVR